MHGFRLLSVAGSALLLLPLAASAQHGAAPHMAPVAPRMVSGPPPAAPRVTIMPSAPRIVIPTPAPRTGAPRRRSGNVTININNNSNPARAIANIPACPLNFVPVPGLGFDIPHLAATQGAAAVGASPAGCGGAFFGAPFFDSGFFIPTASPTAVQMPPIVIQQPVVVQQPAAEPAADTEDSPRSSAHGPAAVDETPAEPPREIPEFVFVRRDGKMLFAVAYLWEKDHLEYITRDGVRRTIGLDALDLEATKRFNEERGLTFRLPA